ncbi:MAG TPA: hypothetical protein IAA46_12340 [Candidatus Gemmiger avium]|nr:hypothetical protein [Candidatus Gemmiger avium]
MEFSLQGSPSEDTPGAARLQAEKIVFFRHRFPRHTAFALFAAGSSGVPGGCSCREISAQAKFFLETP